MTHAPVWLSNAKRSPSFVAGTTLVGLVASIAMIGVFWTPYDPLTVDSTQRFAGPSAIHILGTDQLGRDVLSNMIEGARTTLLAGALATLIAIALGATLGVLAAASRKWIDDIITAVATVFVAFPALLLALVIVAARGPSTSTVVFTVGIAAGASVTVVTRGTLSMSCAARTYRRPDLLVAPRHGLFPRMCCATCCPRYPCKRRVLRR